MSAGTCPTEGFFVWQYLGFLALFLIATMILNLLHNDSAPKRGPTLYIF